jgi:hypothetical protein
MNCITLNKKKIIKRYDIYNQVSQEFQVFVQEHPLYSLSLIALSRGMQLCGYLFWCFFNNRLHNWLLF